MKILEVECMLNRCPYGVKSETITVKSFREICFNCDLSEQSSITCPECKWEKLNSLSSADFPHQLICERCKTVVTVNPNGSIHRLVE